MKMISRGALSSLLPLLVCTIASSISATTSASVDQGCTWKVSVVSIESRLGLQKVPFQNDRELIPLQEFMQHVQVNNLHLEKETYYSYPFFLHLEVLCADPQHSSKMAQSVVSLGVHPQVTITHKSLHQDNCHDGSRTKYSMTGVLVDHDTLKEPHQEPSDQQDCGSSLCHPSWVSPLIMDECSLIIQINVDTVSLDRLIQPARHMVHADGYIMKQPVQPDTTSPTYINVLGSTIDNVNVSLLLQESRSYKITFVPSATPSLVIAGFENSSMVLMSSSEFQDYEVVEVTLPQANIICDSLSTTQHITQALSFPDRIILNTPAGLYEIFGFYGFLEDASYSNANYGTLTPIPLPAIGEGEEECVKEIVLTPHTYVDRVVILAVGNRRAMSAVVTSGAPVAFEQLVDKNERSVCEAIVDEGSTCSIVCAGVGGVHSESFLFLIQSKEEEEMVMYHLVTLTSSTTEGDTEWIEINKFSSSEVPHNEPGHDHPVQLAPISNGTSETMIAVNLNLTGVTFIGLVSHHLFMWGNVLLHSPDGGLSVFLLSQYTSSSKIVLFSVSRTNAFAFTNDQNELWYGIVGNTVELHKLRPSTGWTLQFSGLNTNLWHTPTDQDDVPHHQHTLSLFFDHDDQLFELTVAKNSSHPVDESGHIMRKAIPIADIMAYQRYSMTTHQDSTTNDTYMGSDEDASHCPFLTITFEAGINQFHERVQHFVLGEPGLTNPNQLHTLDSIMVYQGLVHQAILHSAQDIPKVVANTLYDPMARWKDSKCLQQDYYEWQYRTKLLHSGIYVNYEAFGKFSERRDHVDTELPSIVYLDLDGAFHFSVYLSLDKPYVHIAPLDSLWLTVDVSDISLVEILVSRIVNYLTNTVKYELTVQDKGLLQQQQGIPGLTLHPASVLLQVWNSAFKCVQPSDIGFGEIQGSYSMDVLLGCAPGTRLVFDLNSTLEYAITEFEDIYDCPSPITDMPCFYYKQAFYPFFRVLDLVTGEAALFTGKYTLSVIGGSQGGLADMRYFSKEEQDHYNLQDNAKHDTLIWTPTDGNTNCTNDSAVVFTSEHNGIQWHCQQHSVCSDVPLKFPYAPEYFFLIEVSNRDVDADRTYCEYAVQFIIRVHGFPISPMRSVAIVMWAFGILSISVIAWMIWNQNRQRPIRMCKMVKRRRKKKTRVAPVIDDDDDDQTEITNRNRRGRSMGNLSTASNESEERVLDMYEEESALFLKIRRDQDSSFSIHQRHSFRESTTQSETISEEPF